MLARAVVVQEGISDGVRRVGAYQCAQECEHEWHMLGHMQGVSMSGT